MKKLVILVVALGMCAVPALAQSPKACSLLSPDQVARVLGQPASEHESAPLTKSRNGVTVTLRVCTWRIGSRSLSLTWAHFDSTGGSILKQMEQEIQAELRGHGVTLTPLPGLGDEAYSLADPQFPGVGVRVRKGHSVLSVLLLNVRDALAAQALAKSALSRMP